MGQGLLQEGLGEPLGAPGWYLGAGAALWPQRPPRCPEAGAEVGGAGAGGKRDRSEGEEQSPQTLAWEPVASSGAIPPHPWPYQPCPHQILRGPRLVLQNGAQTRGCLLSPHLHGERGADQRQGRGVLNPGWGRPEHTWSWAHSPGAQQSESRSHTPRSPRGHHASGVSCGHEDEKGPPGKVRVCWNVGATS